MNSTLENLMNDLEKYKTYNLFQNKNKYLLYGKASLKQIHALWLVLSWSGFCSMDRSPSCVFLFWSKADKFKICNQNSEKKNVNIVILHSETSRKS